MSTPLRQEFEYYLKHQEELVRKYDGRYVVVKGQEIIGVFEDELKAFIETKKQHPAGTFLVQKVAPGDGAYTQSFHSRVAFA